MKFDKAPDWPCEDIGQGDGIDPRYESEPRKRVLNRKALQLCAQVMDTLNLTLAGYGDDCLRNLDVESVVPAPGSADLLVSVRTAGDEQETWASLQRASGKLRHDIASAIHRKKAPQLRFRVRS